MARSGGADAIVLRAATRAAGVTPRAAYRHFSDREALSRAVADAALAKMTDTIALRQDGALDAATMLAGVGLGYIQFALDEPGWFDVAFFAMGATSDPRVVETDSAGGRSPYQQLEDALARLVETNVLDAAHARDAAVLCWSGVHGFATLTTRGPLHGLARDVVDGHAERLVAGLVTAVTQPTAGRR
jgi:AcrR family transcriptional regulator